MSTIGAPIEGRRSLRGMRCSVEAMLSGGLNGDLKRKLSSGLQCSTVQM